MARRRADASRRQPTRPRSASIRSRLHVPARADYWSSESLQSMTCANARTHSTSRREHGSMFRWHLALVKMTVRRLHRAVVQALYEMNELDVRFDVCAAIVDDQISLADEACPSASGTRSLRARPRPS